MSEFWMYHIDTTCLFQKAEYFFEFEGRKYRLIRGTDKEFDKLCTITDGTNEENQKSHEVTIKLLDYLAWELGQPIRYIGAGGRSYREGKITLETALISCFHGRTQRGLLVDVSRIPDVSNNTQRVALSLWNEARATNSSFLAFINYWKILELPAHGVKRKGRAHYHATKWINSVPSSRVYMGKEMEAVLKQENIDLGTYLYDRCRNAIAHVTRLPVLYSGRVSDRTMIARACRVAQDLAKYYIREGLGLKGYPMPFKGIKTKKSSTAFKLLKVSDRLLKK